jgi:predicted ATP-dependent serine protease
MKLTLVRGALGSGKTSRIFKILGEKYKNEKVFYYNTDRSLDHNITHTSYIHYKKLNSLRSIELDLQTFSNKDDKVVAVIDCINFLQFPKMNFESKYNRIITNIMEIGKRNSIDIIISINMLECFVSKYHLLDMYGIEVVDIT